MNRSRDPSALDSADLLPFLPLLYVAWADGELDAREIDDVRKRLRSLGCTADCRGHLDAWLDPEDPPEAGELRLLRSALQRAGRELAPRGRRSLVELALELASGGAKGDALADERRALDEIEESLGLARDIGSQLLETPRPAEAARRDTSVTPTDRLQRFLDGPRGDLRRRLRDRLSQEDFEYRRGLDKESYREQVLAWCRTLADEGFGALSYPRSAGGEDDMEGFLVVFETLATHDLSLLVKFGVQFGLWGGSVLFLGTEEQQRRWLPQIGSLELPGCFAMTERGHGSNVNEIETVARYDRSRGEFEIHSPTESAGKDYIGNAAAHGRVATVFAQLRVEDEEYGVHALVVPIRDRSGVPLPGVRIEDCGLKLGLNGVDNGRLWFDHVRVPRDHLLGRFAEVTSEGEYRSPIASEGKRFFTMLGTLVGGRVSVAAGALSAAKSGLVIALRYGDRRRQFGPPGEPETLLLDYPIHQRRLLPRLARAYALHFAIAELQRRYLELGSDQSTEQDRRDVELLAAGLKAASSWNTIDTLQACRECCGGVGYLAENRFADLKADTDVFATFEGDNVVLLQLVAKGLLANYRAQFNDPRITTLLRHLGRRALTELSERNPGVVRRIDRDHLRDPDFQRAAFAYRAERLLGTLAQRLRTRLAEGIPSNEALLECQTHMVTAARAHVDRVVLESFILAVETSDDEALRAPLTALRSLYALDHLERQRGWYLEHGYFADGKAEAIRDQVDLMCAELRAEAVPLADAFGIPDPLLDAPIAVRREN